MSAKQTVLALLAGATLAFAAPHAFTLPPAQAETTINREPDWFPDKTPGRGDVVIHERNGLLGKRTEVHPDGSVDANDTEFAGFSLATWIVLGLVVLTIGVVVIANKRREPPGEPL
ncbi:MAG: hypothetical protein ACAI44_36700 [Candidatus Sericytochromatia bacterium]